MHKTFDKMSHISSIKIILSVIAPILSQQFRRLAHSFGHLLTTATGSGVTLSLFMYIFGDFLKEKLPQTNSQAAETLRFYLIFGLMAGSGLVIFRWCSRLLFSTNGWTNYLESTGIHRSHISRGSKFSFCAITILTNLLSALVIGTFFGPLTISHWACLVSVVIFSLFSADKKFVISGPQAAAEDIIDIQDNKFSLVTWRERRLRGYRWRGSALRLISGTLLFMGPATVLTGKPLELAQMASLFGGIVLSWIVPLVIEEDLRFTWLERQAAISHKQWINAWQTIFTKWSMIVFFMTLALSAAFGLYALYFIQHAQQAWQPGQLISNALLASVVAAFPVWLAPAFVLQIDGRQIATNVVMLTLVGIFVGTAIIAVPVLIPGIWLLGHEAHRYQEGRFARASYY